ncbi:tyrosine-type recombinase/integrase [Microbispora amethystogenes]|uniref:tyrosine-type recombinase/integrase n=1 Tax=Microbispora amethystogenes TaxID=1427754 RepID=UPI0033CB3A30
MTGELELPGGEVRLSGDDPWERLALLDAAAEEYEPRADNTLRSYASDWRVWERYVAEVGIPLEAGTTGAFLGFVVWMARRGDAPASVQRRLYGAAVTLRDRGVPVSPKATRKAKLAVDELAKELAKAGETRGRGQVPVLTVIQLRRMCEAQPVTPAGLRNRALLTVGFGAAMRSAEAAGLRRGDIEVTNEGLIVRIRFGKTGGREVAVKRGDNEWTCPQRSWAEWAGVFPELGPDAPAFPQIGKHGNLRGPMAAQSVSTIVRQAGEAVGIAGLTMHSGRAGLATAARAAGHDYKTIAEQGGWAPNSTALHEYLRIVDRWADNATAGIGL